MSILGVPSLLEYFGSPSTLHELVLRPNMVIMTQDRCDDLLQLTQLRLLEISAGSVANAVRNLEYNWDTAAGLFSHPGLTKLSWTNMRNCKYSLDGEEVDAEDVVMVPPHEGWDLEVLSGMHCLEEGYIMCQVDFADIVAERAHWPFNMVFTRGAACQA